MLRLPAFTYLQPKSLNEALAMKADAGPGGMFVAGGTDLYPNMKRRHQEPRTVISLMGIPELRRLDGWKVGTCVTLTELSNLPTVQRSYPAVARAAELVSTPLLRNMGTLGGNLCLDTRCNYYDQTYEWRKAIDFCMKKDGHICWVAPSSPRCWAVSSSDLAPVMVALDAEYLLVGPAGERVVPAGRFYHNDGINYLTKQPDEILAGVRLPAPDGWDAAYHKLRRRGSFDFPVLGVAAWIKGEQGAGPGRGGADRARRSGELAAGGARGGRGARGDRFVRRRDRGRRGRRLSPGEADGQHRLRPLLAEADDAGLRGPRPRGTTTPAALAYEAFDLGLRPAQDLHQALARRVVARPPSRAVHRLDEPPRGAVHVGHPAAERAVHGIADPLEDLVHHVAMLVQELPAGIGDFVHLLAFDVLRRHQPLVLEVLQRRIDGAGRRGVAAVQLLLQFLHHFVAVARLVLEQFENHVLHVTRCEPLPAAAPGAAPEEAAGAEAEGKRIPSELPSHLIPPVGVVIRCYVKILWHD